MYVRLNREWNLDLDYRQKNPAWHTKLLPPWHTYSPQHNNWLMDGVELGHGAAADWATWRNYVAAPGMDMGAMPTEY